jgi:hypothetical protein
MAAEKTPIRRVLYCPHCGNRAPQRLIHRQRYYERSWYVTSGEESRDLWSTFVAVCETCGKVLLYDNLGDVLDDAEFEKAELEYPKSGGLSMDVPETIRKVYEEAVRTKEIAPNAFAVQVRRALEALCEDRDAKGHSLAEKLKDLSSRGEIPPVLAEMTDVLRIIGNIGAHGISESVHPLQASAIDEFFKAVIEYVYVAPAKLRAFKEGMESSKKSETKVD